MYQGTHCTGKTGKMAKEIPCQGKHREFGNFAKTQGIWFAQVVNSLNKGKIYFDICHENFQFFFKLDKSAKSVLLYVKVINHVNWHRENEQADRETTGKIIGNMRRASYFSHSCHIRTHLIDVHLHISISSNLFEN